MEHKNATGYIVHAPRKAWGVFVIAVLVFVATYGVLDTLQIAPGNSAPEVFASVDGESKISSGQQMPAEYPTYISIPTLDLSVAVANPSSADASVLDAELLKGAVRYPTSGLLGTDGANVVIFAHSSYLPVVRNLSYKAFDGIQNMKEGEKIYVTGKGRTYVYAVEGVHSANANVASVPLSVEGNKLTLITCDSFATKSDRYIVVATLVESYLNTN